MRAQTVGISGRPKLRLTLLPPPGPRNNPLAVAEYGKAAEVRAHHALPLLCYGQLTVNVQRWSGAYVTMYMAYI